MSITIALKEVPAFASFEVDRNTPVLSFDLKDLVSTVGQLWDGMKKHKLVFDAVDDELSRRRTEMEVRFRTMQTDLEDMVRKEAHKREAEDDILRREIERLQNLLSSEVKLLQDQAKEREESMNRTIDRATAALKGTILDTQGRVSNLSDEIEKLRSRMDGIKVADDPNFDRIENLIDQKHKALCSFIGTSPDGVQSAIKSGTTKEAFLKVPALVEIQGRIKTVDALSTATAADVKLFFDQLKLAQIQIEGLKGDLQKTAETIRETEVRVTDEFIEGDKRLSRRIDDLAAQLLCGSHPTSNVQIDLSGPLKMIRDDMDLLERRVRKIEGEMHNFASKDMLNTKADLASINNILDQLRGHKSTIDEHTTDIASLKNRPATVQTVTTVSEKASPPTFVPAGPDERIPAILSKIADLDRQCSNLQETKADKIDVNNALKDLMKRIEKALNGLLSRIVDLESQSNVISEATSGRFRCLSCNRTAGPLQEQLEEKMSFEHFPPSHMYVNPSRASRPSSAHVPGMRDYGGGVTSSRKKLMNYYTWLQDRAESPQTDQHQTVSPRRTSSPGMKHPWAGAQSGNGEAGERQCGDHGTPEPDAVGTDGKFYVGVRSRPQSAKVRSQ